MQTVSDEDSLHEMSNPVFWEIKINIISLSSAESAHNMVSVTYSANLFKTIIFPTSFPLLHIGAL